MNERPHVDYFDGLRIFAALCVIFMHTAAGPLRAGVNTDWHLLNVCTSLAFTAVPLFFMMSGYLLMTSRKTADISVLLRHRLPRLVVPLAGWTVVAVLWQALLAFAACFVVTKTVATIRPLCYLATGKTYAEACRSCNWVYTFRRLRGHSAAEK